MQSTKSQSPPPQDASGSGGSSEPGFRTRPHLVKLQKPSGQGPQDFGWEEWRSEPAPASSEADAGGEEVESVFTGKTCMQCRVAKVKCDKHDPCNRCVRRGYTCSAQARGPGRPPASEAKKKKSAQAQVTSTTGRGKRKKTTKSADAMVSNSRNKSKNSTSSSIDNNSGGNPYSYPPLHVMQLPGQGGHPGYPGHPAYPPMHPSFPPFWGAQGYDYGMAMQNQYMNPMQHTQTLHEHQAQMQQQQQQQQMQMPDSVTSRFLSLIPSGAYTPEKIHAVINMMSSLACERSSAVLSRAVLQAISLVPDMHSSINLPEIRRLANSFGFEGYGVMPSLPNILDGIPKTAPDQTPPPPPAGTLSSDGKPKDFTTAWLKEIDGPDLIASRVTWDGKTTYKVSKSFGETFFNENLAKRCYAIGQDPWYNLLTTHQDEDIHGNMEGNPNFYPYARNEGILFEKAISCILTEPPMRLEYQRLTKLMASNGQPVKVIMLVRSELSSDGRGLWQIMKLQIDPEQITPTYSAPLTKPPSLYPIPTNPFNYMQNSNVDVISVNARVASKAADLLVQNNIGDLLELCTENVFVDSGRVDPIVSILGTYIGKKQMAKFCESFHSAFIIHSFKLENFEPSGNFVRAMANYEFTSKINSVRSPSPHNTQTRWMFNDEGKVSGIFIEVSSAEWSPYFQTQQISNPLVKDVAGLNTPGGSSDTSSGDDNVKLLPRGQRESARDWKDTIEMFTKSSKSRTGFPAGFAGMAGMGGMTGMTGTTGMGGMADMAVMGGMTHEHAADDEELASSGGESSIGMSILDQLGGLTPQPAEGGSPSMSPFSGLLGAVGSGGSGSSGRENK